MAVFQFGERVEGYPIPVLNEREIRAGAGLLFLLMFVAILRVIREPPSPLFAPPPPALAK